MLADFAAEMTSSEQPEQIAFDQAIALLKQLCEDASILKIGHNLKYDAHVLGHARHGAIRLSL